MGHPGKYDADDDANYGNDISDAEDHAHLLGTPGAFLRRPFWQVCALISSQLAFQENQPLAATHSTAGEWYRSFRDGIRVSLARI
jgi:hypothetical protein